MTSRRHPTNILSFWQNHIDIVDGGLRNHYCKNITICESCRNFHQFYEHSLPYNLLPEQIMKPNLHLSFKQENPRNYNVTKCKQLSIKKVRNGPCWVIMLSKWYNVRAIFSTRAWTLGIVCVKHRCDTSLSISLLAILWNQQGLSKFNTVPSSLCIFCLNQHHFQPVLMQEIEY